MTTPAVGLVRVTVSTPRRRIDLALPETVAVAEMLPVLLQHGGEELADDGVEHGGWLLRRSDGSALSMSRTLGSYRIRDGELLTLAPGRQVWPELDYDDLVDAIATGSRRRNRTWTRGRTRQAGLAVGAVAIGLAMVAVFRSGPDWAPASRWCLGQAAILLVAATILARAVGDSAAGTMVGLLGLPFAFVGGGLVLTDPGPLDSVTAPQLEAACGLLVLAALLGYLGVGDDGAPFVGALVAGLLGAGGAWATDSQGLAPEHAAAILVSAAFLLTPLYGTLAMWLGRLPMPTLPRTPADLLRDDPQPPRPVVYGAVARADGLFTGQLMGTAAVAAVSAVVLAIPHRAADTSAARWLTVVTAAGFLIRSRLYPIVRQRVPMMVAGLTGIAALLLGPAMREPGHRLGAAGPALLGLGAAAIVIGLAYSRRPPGPYLRRYVEMVEMLLTLSVLPIACAVLDLYSRLRH